MTAGRRLSISLVPSDSRTSRATYRPANRDGVVKPHKLLEL